MLVFFSGASWTVTVAMATMIVMTTATRTRMRVHIVIQKSNSFVIIINAYQKNGNVMGITIVQMVPMKKIAQY